MPARNLLILCGGRSAEHEVALQSAINVVAAVDPHAFHLAVVGIDKDGYRTGEIEFGSGIGRRRFGLIGRPCFGFGTKLRDGLLEQVAHGRSGRSLRVIEEITLG